MLAPCDFWDPNTWGLIEQGACRIYGDARCETFALVSPEDYSWAVQWLWNWKRCRHGSYLKRNLGIARTPLYLHVEIARRAFKQPSSKHIIVDHRDGDTTNNQRSNLRWATPRQNCLNIFGSHAHDLIEG